VEKNSVSIIKAISDKNPPLMIEGPLDEKTTKLKVGETEGSDDKKDPNYDKQNENPTGIPPEREKPPKISIVGNGVSPSDGVTGVDHNKPPTQFLYNFTVFLAARYSCVSRP
jgi:hypothetical protein